MYSNSLPHTGYTDLHEEWGYWHIITVICVDKFPAKGTYLVYFSLCSALYHYFIDFSIILGGRFHLSIGILLGVLQRCLHLAGNEILKSISSKANILM